MTHVDRDATISRLTIRDDLFIDGSFVPSVSGARFDCVSPRDALLVTTVAEGDAEDVSRAVAAARRSFDDGRWSRMHPRERRKILQRLARLVEEHSDELAMMESLDMGKPVFESAAVDLRVVVQSLDFYAEAIDKVYDDVAPTAHDVHATVTREPIGVVGAVIPWNFPLMMASWKFAPALAAGNSMVLKPAEQSPLTALRFAELAAMAGIPDGVLNIVTGFGPTAGAALGRHMDVDALAFTGSGPVGREFLRYSADSNLKQVSLELGGKSPQIVMADAPDTDVVASAVIDGIFFNQGEMCSAGSRLLVHESRRDELVDGVLTKARALAPGDPLDPATRLGALVEEQHLDRVLGFVEGAVEEGAETLMGGTRVDHPLGGYYMGPTVIDGVRPEMRIAREEVFGPVLAVLPFDSIEEGVRLANDTAYGLAASVWTRDLSTAHLTAQAIRAGTVWVNCFDASDISVPFGGYKESGIGRDKGIHALDKYTQIKTTWMQL